MAQVLNTWKFDNDGIVFILSNGNEYYYIDNYSLGQVRNEHWMTAGLTAYNVSEWIAQLIEKKWIEKRHLYELAKLIQRYAPTNKIDWVETFWMLEVEYQLNYIWDAMKETGEIKYETNGTTINFSEGQEKRNISLFGESALKILKEKNLLHYKNI